MINVGDLSPKRKETLRRLVARAQRAAGPWTLTVSRKVWRDLKTQLGPARTWVVFAEVPRQGQGQKRTVSLVARPDRLIGL